MHLMTSHTSQLDFLLPELLTFSDDLDTEERRSLVFSCPTPRSPQTKREIKLPPGQGSYVLFLLPPRRAAARLKGAAPCALPREKLMPSRYCSAAWLGSNPIPVPLGKSPILKKSSCLGPSSTLPTWKSFPYLLCCVTQLQHKKKILIFCRSSWTFVPFPDTGTPPALQMRGCPVVLSQNTAWSSPGGSTVSVDGEVRRITEKSHKPPPNPSADLTLASHSSPHIFSSVNSTSINFPGQNLLSWPCFSWINHHKGPVQAAASCQAQRWQSLGGRVAQHPKNPPKSTQGSMVPSYSRPPESPPTHTAK